MAEEVGVMVGTGVAVGVGVMVGVGVAGAHQSSLAVQYSTIESLICSPKMALTETKIINTRIAVRMISSQGSFFIICI